MIILLIGIHSPTRAEQGSQHADARLGPTKQIGGECPVFQYVYQYLLKGHRIDAQSSQVLQTQIAIAYPSVPFGNPGYYAAQGAVQVLSGGMGARLFTEIREKTPVEMFSAVQ